MHNKKTKKNHVCIGHRFLSCQKMINVAKFKGKPFTIIKAHSDLHAALQCCDQKLKVAPILLFPHFEEEADAAYGSVGPFPLDDVEVAEDTVPQTPIGRRIIQKSPSPSPVPYPTFQRGGSSASTCKRPSTEEDGDEDEADKPKKMVKAVVYDDADDER